MNKEKLILRICAAEKQLNLLTGRRNRYSVGYDGNSVEKVLGVLSSTEGEIHPTDLCKRLGVTTPRITTILNDMEEKGLVERRISAVDRRKIVVTLTEAGNEVVEQKREKDREFLSKVCDRLSSEDADALLRILSAYADAYEEMLEAEGK